MRVKVQKYECHQPNAGDLAYINIRMAKVYITASLFVFDCLCNRNMFAITSFFTIVCYYFQNKNPLLKTAQRKVYLQDKNRNEFDVWHYYIW